MSTEPLAGRMRQALAGRAIAEQRMFGGICFMIDGNMAACASRHGMLVRVGKDSMAAALKKKGTRPMTMGGRTMSGYVYVEESALGGAALTQWMEDALQFVATLPPKKTSAAKKERPAGGAGAKPRRRAR